MVKRWLISGIVATYNYRHQRRPKSIQGILVLVGGEGLGKSRWCRSLVGPLDSCFLDGGRLENDKDTIAANAAHWIVELGEVEQYVKAHKSGSIKAYITRSVDKVRLPYDRSNSEFPRQTIFCGTTNESNFMNDPTGANRRWWALTVTTIYSTSNIDMQQVWAQAKHFSDAGEPHYLNNDELKLVQSNNTHYKNIDPLEEQILAHLNLESPERRLVTCSELLIEMGYPTPKPYESKRAGRVLRKHFGDNMTTQKGLTRFSVPYPKC